MNFLMMDEVFAKVESCLAFGTFVAFPSVGLPMLSKTKDSAETPATLVTLVGFTTCVGFLLLHRL